MQCSKGEEVYTPRWTESCYFISKEAEAPRPFGRRNGRMGHHSPREFIRLPRPVPRRTAVEFSTSCLELTGRQRQRRSGQTLAVPGPAAETAFDCARSCVLVTCAMERGLDHAASLFSCGVSPSRCPSSRVLSLVRINTGSCVHYRPAACIVCPKEFYYVCRYQIGWTVGRRETDGDGERKNCGEAFQMATGCQDRGDDACLIIR